MLDVFRRIFAVILASRIQNVIEAREEFSVSRDYCMQDSVSGPCSQILIGDDPSVMSLTSTVKRSSEVTHALNDKLTDCIPPSLCIQSFFTEALQHGTPDLMLVCQCMLLYLHRAQS